MMLTLAEELILLILDDDTGKVVTESLIGINYALAGSILMDLALRSKIDTDLENLLVVDPTPTGIDGLDEFLDKINSSEETHSTSHWVSLFSFYGPDIQKNALDMLVDRGILKQEEKKVLWVFGARRYPVIDDKEEKEVKHRIIHLLLSEDIPTPHDVVLMCLADTCNLLPHILSNKEIEYHRTRIDQIKHLDLIGQEVSKSISILRADLAALLLQH